MLNKFLTPGLIFVGLAGFFVAFKRHFDNLNQNIANSVQKFAENVVQNKDNTGPEQVSRTEFDELKRAMATLEGDVLKNLNKTSARERRARIYEQGGDPELEDDEEEPADPQLVKAGLEALNNTNNAPVAPPGELTIEMVQQNIRNRRK